jgi:hypothetical protein
MQLEKYSFGTGDRFGQQGPAQLKAVQLAAEQGVDVAIVWNKSHREHQIVGTSPADVRQEADAAIKGSGWRGGYYVDADHIGLDNVDQFVDPSDFFTIDVADFIGHQAEEHDISAFVEHCRQFTGVLQVEGMERTLRVSSDQLRAIAEKYLFAIQQAANIHTHISNGKGDVPFVTEVSMDETDEPQSPEELFFILAAIAAQRIPIQTIAPKFTGRFNKGVDFVGDVEKFNQEFSDDVCVVNQAIVSFGLPENLKLSVHSGSDKFSIYPGIHRALKTHGAGVHVKTAGTTWLEELVGLAEAGGEALLLVKHIYRQACGRYQELCGPYAAVIDIDQKHLPAPDQVDAWEGTRLMAALRHDQSNPDYNSNLRQLLHVAYKVAAESGSTYLEALGEHRQVIGRHVTDNLFERHIRPLFF